MRTIKTLPILALMAVAAMAIVVPAAASADTKWTDYQFPIGINQNIGYKGSVKVAASNTGVQCGVTSANAKIIAGGKQALGENTSFVFGACTPYGGNLNNCNVTSASASTPSPIQGIREGETGKVVMTGFSYTFKFASKPGLTCSFGSWTVNAKAEGASYLVDKPLEMSTWKGGGSVEVSMTLANGKPAGTATLSMSGDFTLNEPGRYGIAQS